MGWYYDYEGENMKVKVELGFKLSLKVWPPFNMRSGWMPGTLWGFVALFSFFFFFLWSS